MKRFSAAILAILYLVISSGIALEIHYCMGKRAGVELYGTGSDKCGRCGMTDTKSGCCHDEYKLYKLDDSHKLVSNDIKIAAGEMLLPGEHILYHWTLPEANTVSGFNDHSPPKDTGPSACVLNCVFRL